MIETRLRVWLKGVDLVASTAYLTLVEKMGFGSRLRAVKRFDDYRWTIDSDEGPSMTDRLKRVLAVQSTFYNRNKHNYLLECSWQDHCVSDGTAFEELERRLRREAVESETDDSQEFDSQSASSRVILKNVKLYRTCVRVEDRERTGRDRLASRLGGELGAPVTFGVAGTSWLLVLAVPSPAEAEEAARSIVVSQRRDRGLLANPNNQAFEILSIDPLESNGP